MEENPFDSALPFLTIMKSVKGTIRTVLLAEHIATLTRANLRERIIDVGCGSAEVTCELMRRELARVTVLVDLSSEMLIEARRTAELVGVSAQCEFRQTDFGDVIPTYHFRPSDMMVCHAVLNWLVNPVDSLEVLFRIAQESSASVSFELGSRFGHVLERNYSAAA